TFFSTPPPTTKTKLFPYTTLFRSAEEKADGGTRRRTNPPRHDPQRHGLRRLRRSRRRRWLAACFGNQLPSRPQTQRIRQARRCRSEDHTSELQSQSNLVCRLLLEK